MENRDNTTKYDQDMRQADGATSQQPQQSEQINIKFGKGLDDNVTLSEQCHPVGTGMNCIHRSFML